jgi:hypothetical protein
MKGLDMGHILTRMRKLYKSKNVGKKCGPDVSILAGPLSKAEN